MEFVLFCLLSRFFYALNDVFTGRLARESDRLELAALRGVSLGFAMAPLLFWVPRSAWSGLASESGNLAGVVSITAVGNVLLLQSARYLPFGIRASVMLTGLSLGSVVLGYAVLGERLSAGAAGWCLLIVAGAALAAPGEHATHEIQPRLVPGMALALVGGGLMAVAGLLLKGLVESSHAFLAGWAWEFGAGLVLVPILLVRLRRRSPRGLPKQFARVALASSPTAIGSSLSMLALGSGRLGLWGALAGTQVLFTAVLGVLWHRELMGFRRWACFVAAGLGVAGLALNRQ
jgi:drug/metabolite transporter (DMT)-like permease